MLTGFEYGNPLNFPFDHWINQSPNVVIVAVYYRLDSFGFLTHPAFVSDPSLGDLNAGIQDQIMALKWIQQNIRSFGGDPTRVTINGQSAGAESVLIHLIANGGKNKNLFSKAFAQSTDRRVTPQPAQQEVNVIADCRFITSSTFPSVAPIRLLCRESRMRWTRKDPKYSRMSSKCKC